MRWFWWAVSFATAATARPTSLSQLLYIIELAPGETRHVTEAEKFALIDQGIHFIDITEWLDKASILADKVAVTYPDELTQDASVEALNAQLDAAKMKRNLNMFSSFNNRYYQSQTGNLSAEWLAGQAKSYIPAGSPATVSIFQHVYRQSSIVVTIPGKTAKTIVVGAHMDSINGAAGGNRTTARAPGADDNGSGSMTTLEALRVLLKNETIASGAGQQTIEFHWYAAEEIGLLGSGNIFRAYADEGRDIAAMLNQDMTGYTAGYRAQNMTPKFGVVTDNVDLSLTDFVRKIISRYTKTEAADTRCGYACSDHVSATRAGFPSAFIFEGEMNTVNDNPYVHSDEDTIEKVDFEHMLEHGKMVVGFVMELAFASL